MNQTTAQASQKEKDLIGAMNSRYPAGGMNLGRDSLNMQYAGMLRGLVSAYPNDQDIKALFIDAVMLIHPWDFWNNDGSKKKWTGEILDLCESVLKANPHHPAALHYYIHLT